MLMRLHRSFSARLKLEQKREKAWAGTAYRCMTMREAATVTDPKTARSNYVLNSGFPRRRSALALMTAHTSDHRTSVPGFTSPELLPWLRCTFSGINPKTPALDLFIGRDHDAWRIYLVAETS
jgi:hypothetical protein